MMGLLYAFWKKNPYIFGTEPNAPYRDCVLVYWDHWQRAQLCNPPPHSNAGFGWKAFSIPPIDQKNKPDKHGRPANNKRKR